MFALATIACFFAKSLPFLLAVRAVQALGAAAALSVMSAMVRTIYKPSHLGRGLALNTCSRPARARRPRRWAARSSASRRPAARRPLRYFRRGRVDADLRTRDLRHGSRVHGASPAVAAPMILAGLSIGVFLIRHELRQPAPIIPIDLLRQPVIGLSGVGARTASAGGLTSTVRLIGQTLGATMLAALLALHLGEGGVPVPVACGLAATAGILSIARLNPALRRPRADELEAGVA